MPQPTRATLFTLPNVVSLSRIAFAAGFVASRSTDTRLTLIGAASLSDFLDGGLARRGGTASHAGALIDPIADRAFVFAAVVSFLRHDEITVGQYFTLLSRDLATAVGFLVARSVRWLRAVSFQARFMGKVVTVLQLVTLAALIVTPELAPWFIALVGVASVLSIADYTLALWRARAR
jgi:phosphatidylglycerophosphate synthase